MAIESAQRVWLDMLGLAGKMMDALPSSPEYADMRTSMCDLRAARLIARGMRPEDLDANGYPNDLHAR